MSVLKKEIIFDHAVDWAEQGKPQHGVNCALLTFKLEGPSGCITFTLNTGWYPQKNNLKFKSSEPSGYYINVHGSVPDGDDSYRTKCCYLPSGKCYASNYFLGFELRQEFINKGTDFLWPLLTYCYTTSFGFSDFPDSELAEVYETIHKTGEFKSEVLG